MNKRFNSVKSWPVWVAISAVVILAGIILMAWLGFNMTAGSKTVEVSYDSVGRTEESQQLLQDICESAFDGAKLSYTKSISTEIDSNYLNDAGYSLLTYTFNANTDSSKLDSVKRTIEQSISSNASFAEADITVSVHDLVNEKFYEAAWRGGVALGVAAIVALVYVGFRFGVGQALVGLVACVNDVLFTLGVFAIVRIPVYAYAPVLFAGLAAIFSVIFWLIQCAKMRENFKDPAYASLAADEAIGESLRSSNKHVITIAIAFAVVLAVFGGVATAGLRLFMLPALIPLAVSVYSSLLLAPAVYAPIKAKFDKLSSKRKRYAGKQKGGAEE